MGFSHGAYVMSCALGQYGKDLGVAGAVCVSPAYDAHFVNKNMRNNPLAWPYGWFLIYRLMSLYESDLDSVNPAAYPTLRENLFTKEFGCIMWHELMTVRSMDKVNTVGDYEDMMCALAEKMLPRVDVPVLYMWANDDPLANPEVVDRYVTLVKSSPSASILVAPAGGHCSFYTGGICGGEGFWSDVAARHFLTAVLEERDATASVAGAEGDEGMALS
jgi:predicted alpha/beta-fold hydrolase